MNRGPVFTDLLLVDEINRMPPRTQSALLEAMEEFQVTIDGTSYPLSRSFAVFATQNPVEFEGTYPLPEAQLDRFLMKIRIGYPEATQESEILSRYQSGFEARDFERAGLERVSKETLQTAREEVARVQVEPKLFDYIVSHRPRYAGFRGGQPGSQPARRRGDDAGSQSVRRDRGPRFPDSRRREGRGSAHPAPSHACSSRKQISRASRPTR